MTDGNEPINISINYGPYGTNGLTKREYFAAMAMQGIFSSSEHFTAALTDPQKIEYSVQIADRLIKALNEPA